MLSTTRPGTFLLAWEMGAGMGHLANLAPVATRLKERGHQVVAALRDVSLAPRLFTGTTFVAAPASHQPAAGAIAEPSSFAELLFNSGWGDAGTLEGLVGAWRHLYELVAPDVVVTEFSPTALLAARTTSARSVVIGTGFYCPPDVSPLPDLRPWRNNYPDRLRMTEERVLSTVNRTLAKLGAESLSRLSALHAEVDANVFATFRELDHYPERQGATYRGTWARVPGKKLQWPEANGPRIFAYLRPFPAFRALLDALRERGCPTVMHLVGVPTEPLVRFGAPNIRFETDPVDIETAARECDLAILYAPHDTTAELLLAGKPLLLVPQHMEQTLVARNARRLEAARVVSMKDGDEVVTGLREVIEESRFADAARAFADRYAGHDPARVVGEVVDELETLLPR